MRYQGMVKTLERRMLSETSRRYRVIATISEVRENIRRSSESFGVCSETSEDIADVRRTSERFREGRRGWVMVVDDVGSDRGDV
jgi:hypothetical protein